MEFKTLLFLAILSITSTANADSEYKSYKDYKVYKVVPANENHVQILLDLQKELVYSFWTETFQVGSDVRIMVAPENIAEFEDYLNGVGIELSVAIEDIQKLIDYQLKRPAHANRQVRDYAWDYYQTLEEIYEWLDQIITDFPGIVTGVTIGRTAEGRPIRGVKINYRNASYPIMGVLEGGIHAREWISPATLTYIINEFLTSTDPNVRALAENVVWHIFPVTNPDGYAYTFTNNRMWRKNRNPANHASCSQWNLDDDMGNGIDLNRNFGYLWMTTGASQNPCSEVYAGPVQSSELETISLIQYVTGIRSQGSLLYYFAFHSYSQMVLVPFSHLGGADVLGVDNYADLYEIAIKAMDKLRDVHGTNYVVGTSMDILYPTSGGSFDWAKGVANIPIVYLFELRDVGQYGFLLPSEFIIPNNEEIMAGLIEIDRVTKQLGYVAGSGGIFYVNFMLLAVSLLILLKL